MPGDVSRFSGCSGTACSEADPELCWEPRQRRLAQLSQWPGLPQAPQLLGPPTARTCLPNPSDIFRWWGEQLPLGGHHGDW